MGLLQEISQQPEAFRELITYYRSDNGRSLLNQARDMAGISPRTFTFVGMGTSLHVAHMIQDSLCRSSTVPVIIRDASEVLHYGLQCISYHDVVIVISQSGESVETCGVVRGLTGHPRLISITNNPKSTIARLCRLNLPMVAGEESSITTKTYTNGLALMAMLDKAFACRDVEPGLQELESVVDLIEKWEDRRREQIDHAAELLREVSSMTFIARGPVVAAARQAALTWQEGARIPAMHSTGGAFRHGPMERVGSDQGMLFFCPGDQGGNLLRDMAQEVAGLGSPTVAFTSEEMFTDSLNLFPVMIPTPNPVHFSLACAIPQELLMERMARDRGVNAGEFRFGGKVTLRE